MERIVDGNASLKEQENTLGFAENVAIVKLVSYVRAQPQGPTNPPAPGPINMNQNLAKFENRDIAVVPPPLKLIALSAGQTAEAC